MSVSVGIVTVQIDKYLSYMWIGYLQIHTIPEYSDIATDTNNTYTYIEYILILIYPHIPIIPANTNNTCI